MISTSDFDFTVPAQLIAQEPAEPRDSSRLMVLNRQTGAIEHRIFHDFCDYLRPGDLLVLNNTKVIPARLTGRKPTGARIELLLLRQLKNSTWEVLIFPGKRVKVGTVIQLNHGSLSCQVIDRTDEGIFLIESLGNSLSIKFLEEVGRIPLPPYIEASRRKEPQIEARYQTIYARELGASAAPTAGLHFTPELLERVRSQGIRVSEITLHTGFGTFRPIRAESADQHQMRSEWCSVLEETVEAIRVTKRNGGRVLAVGTTVVRALESVAQQGDPIRGFSGETSLYVLPGYRFRVVDALMTNFHWPRTTLILLVSAFAGREKILTAYQEAIRQKYRFFSFGDAMLIL